MRTMARYGCLPSLPSPNDYILGVTAPVPEPPAFETWIDAERLDQGQAGSCTGHGVHSGLKCVGHAEGFDLNASRLGLYYNGRLREGTTASDSGAQIKDVLAAAARLGIIPEADWPYDAARVTTRPPASAYQDALKEKVLVYKRVPQTETSIKQALLAGLPIVYGMTVFDSFESPAVAKSGQVPMPRRGESVLGGHCVLAFGYDDGPRTVHSLNSWGPDWGDHGTFYLPYEYFLSPQLVSDLWVVHAVTQG